MRILSETIPPLRTNRSKTSLPLRDSLAQRRALPAAGGALDPHECAACGNFALALYDGLCRTCDLSADAAALVTP